MRTVLADSSIIITQYLDVSREQPHFSSDNELVRAILLDSGGVLISECTIDCNGSVTDGSNSHFFRLGMFEAS